MVCLHLLEMMILYLIVSLFRVMHQRFNGVKNCCRFVVDTPVMISENSTKYPFSKESLILYCNASSYDQINWYHIHVGTTDLNPYQFSWCTPDTCRLRGNSTILVMGEISMELKDSKIICVASCSATGKNATAYTTVSVISIYRVMKYIYTNIFSLCNYIYACCLLNYFI